MQTPDSLGWADLQGGLDSRVLEGWTTLTLQQSRPRGQQGRGSRDHVASPQLPPLLSWLQPHPSPRPHGAGGGANGFLCPSELKVVRCRLSGEGGFGSSR